MSKQTMRGARMLLVAVTALGVSTPVWARQDMAMKHGEMSQHEEGPTRLRSGLFKGLAHETSGSASVYQLPDGRRVLRLEELHTSNGPDLHVYLVEGDDASDDAAIKAGRFVSLGALKGNIGNQNYELPADLDLDRYRSVSIWCKRFGVNFAAAPLPASSGEAS
ncbi:DM13 domain-containing protein [Archangium violaceum]|uniref:DM13 domain-containing protein n=2 Tax=Archangium violaceum TaxID=83451 RepID=UPI0036DE1326